MDPLISGAVAAAIRFIEISTKAALGRVVCEELLACRALLGVADTAGEAPHKPEWTPAREARVRNALHAAVDYINAEHRCPLGLLVVERLRDALDRVPSPPE